MQSEIEVETVETQYLQWSILIINILLLIERIVKGYKYISCTKNGCWATQTSPETSSGTPVPRRKKKNDEMPEEIDDESAEEMPGN